MLLFSVLVGGTDHIFYMRSRYSVSNIDIDMHLYALFACIQEQCHRVNVGGIFPFVYLATQPNAGGFPSKVQRLQKSHVIFKNGRFKPCTWLQLNVILRRFSKSILVVICTSQIAWVRPFHPGCFEGVLLRTQGLSRIWWRNSVGTIPLSVCLWRRWVAVAVCWTTNFNLMSMASMPIP